MSEIEEQQEASVEEAEVKESTTELVDSLPEPTKKTVNPKILVGIATIFALILGGNYFLGGSDTIADEMRLESYNGSVTLQNAAETKEVVEGSRLISEDNLETLTESSAYISLDKAKILKLDEESHMEVVKVEEHLDIELYKGSLYFSVTEPLTDSETLEFHTNNVVTGVRGTSGVITYTEELLQSEVVVLSGTVEVVTIEEEPETVLVNQGEIAIATTQEDGSVTLEVKQQEKTPSYGFSTQFLDDSGEDVEEYTLPDWKEAYTQHLGEIESFYSGHPILEVEHRPDENTMGNYLEYIYPLDFSNTTYWLHDMDLDGIPELFLAFNYTSKGVIEEMFENYLSSRKCEHTSFYLFGLWDDQFQSSWLTANNEGESSDVYTSFNQNSTSIDTLAIPEDGIGIYRNNESLFRDSSGYEYYQCVTVDFFIKNEHEMEHLRPYDGSSGLLDGTPIDTSTWTHYTDLSGLEWNG